MFISDDLDVDAFTGKLHFISDILIMVVIFLSKVLIFLLDIDIEECLISLIGDDNN